MDKVASFLIGVKAFFQGIAMLSRLMVTEEEFLEEFVKVQENQDAQVSLLKEILEEIRKR